MGAIYPGRTIFTRTEFASSVINGGMWERLLMAEHHDEDDDSSHTDPPDALPAAALGEIGRTVRDALTSRPRTVRLCAILATAGASITPPLIIALTLALVIINAR
ncbi:hypothetical protein ABZ897_37040 [Nonomuraea sp. NPDC046802]|uniref:hypothetical protein n=1 Tax=Nonomuraea sp. NPDC046802 TaxID=3154919 RepID=UPI0033F7A61D